MKLDNIVAITIRRSDGEKIVEWFKKKGFDTGATTGIGNSYIDSKLSFYGVIDGKFNLFLFNELKPDTRIYTVDTLPEYPKEMMVSDSPITEDNPGVKQVVLYKMTDGIPSHPYIAVIASDTEQFYEGEAYLCGDYRYAVDIPTTPVKSSKELLIEHINQLDDFVIEKIIDVIKRIK
jgi:hypothetical protein